MGDSTDDADADADAVIGTHGGGPHISGTPDCHDTLTDKIVRQKWSNKKINATWKAQERRR